MKLQPKCRRPPLALALPAVISLLLGSPLAHAKGNDDEANLPWARENRLAVGFTFGFGSHSLGDVYTLAEAANLADPPQQSIQINAEVSVRYYFPYYVLFQVGYGAIYNFASKVYGLTEITNYNLAMEVPILLGGYYPVIKRLYTYAAIGPEVFFFSRLWWDPGQDFQGGSGVGMKVLGGADFMVGRHFSVGLALAYRLLDTGPLKFKNSTQIVPGPGDGYHMDFSGVSLELKMRVYAM